jgi:hypothetical protein
MGDGWPFFWFFAALFVLRIIAATFVYAWLLSEAPECPACGSETLHIERRGVAWLFPRLRPSWCPNCLWEGVLQPQSREQTDATYASRDVTNTVSHSGQFPLISKKSSK